MSIPRVPLPHRVLVVCIGNMCRSPVAEYLLREYAQHSRIPAIRHIQFESAGTRGGYGPMDASSRKYLGHKGILAADFQSRLLRKSLLEACDLVLAMTNALRTNIIDDFFWDRSLWRGSVTNPPVILYTEAAGLGGDVEDPYGYGWSDYLRVMEDVDSLAQRIIATWEKWN